MFILASSSPSRLEVLKKLGFKPSQVISPNILEVQLKGEDPKNYSIRLAKEKGLAVSATFTEMPIISADTVVCVGRRVIEKTSSREEVGNAMKMLSGKNHRIFTTVCLTIGKNQKIKTSESRIKFKRLTEEEIENFVKLDEGLGKAGGYSINGFAESFVIQIVGSISGVVGMPSYEVKNLLSSIGIKPKL